MLTVQFSNRLEVLRESLLRAIGTEVPPSPFNAQQIIVPSSALRRHLTLAIAERHGICANVDCLFLAQWLWREIARWVPSVGETSPFAADALTWRIEELFELSSWSAFPRLAAYLDRSDELMRYELACEVAGVVEQYITYRQDWLATWRAGGVVPLPQASDSQREDQLWQADLWRRIAEGLDAASREHPSREFFRVLARVAGGRDEPLGLPDRVHVFCLPSLPPLYLDMLARLSRRIDVSFYVLNPCREYWFDIVEPKRLGGLAARGAAQHRETGNRLLAAWGRQTRSNIEMLLEAVDDAPIDDEGFDQNFAPTMLGGLQRSIFELTDPAPGSLCTDLEDRSIELHVCHSLTRQFEVLLDRLLALFAEPAPPKPHEILIVTPDLQTAAPIIDAVFGAAPDERRLPYAISGRGLGTTNSVARALLAVLAILPSRFPASALVELLQLPLIGRRFHIGAADLVVIEEWLAASGTRWGFDAEHRRTVGIGPSERFTIADGLDRLFLGYALPQHVAETAFGRVAAGNAEGSRAEILGAFAEFIAHLGNARDDLCRPRLPREWLEVLLALLARFVAPVGEEFDELLEVHETLRALADSMLRGGRSSPVPLALVRASLQTLLAEPAQGGVPTGSITFSSISSLRQVPFRFIAVLGLDEGVFPGDSRPREFDLLAASPRIGDRQRRTDDRNLFLDLVLAARERLYLSYTGRRVRDDTVVPPSAVVTELLDALIPAIARPPGEAAAFIEARRRIVIEHPLQPFSARYFDGSETRLYSFNREWCEALRYSAGAAPRPAEGTVSAEDGNPDDVDAPAVRTVPLFFTKPLPAPGIEWREITLERLRRFFANPVRYLLKERLAISSYAREALVEDEEPLLPDGSAQCALGARLLEPALQGVSATALIELARGGVEFPAGALGAVAIEAEVARIQRFALHLRAAADAAPLPSLKIDLPFVLEGETWRLTTVLDGRDQRGVVRHRYGDAYAKDYLDAWLTHLVAAAASSTPVETRWITRDGGFRFRHCYDASQHLERLLALYRRGLSEPVHFFPKSAWAFVEDDQKLAIARGKWHRPYADFPGEESDEAYRLGLRGASDPLDEDFQRCANTVFGPAYEHLEDMPS